LATQEHLRQQTKKRKRRLSATRRRCRANRI
jgi:hypothetical protein